VVENRSGGNIGADLVARAPPDGCTLLVNASNHVINASLYEKIGYDPLKDFTPIAELASFMLVWVVHPSVPVTTLSEFVALARTQPDRVTVGNGGLGAPTHLCALLFAQAAGLDFVHVPYKGGGPRARVSWAAGDGNVRTVRERAAPGACRQVACACGGKRQAGPP
jgi:tripartite-type tricarboxylate transporter receptor subunit TctC